MREVNPEMIESDRDFGTFEMFCDKAGCEASETFDTDGDFYRMIEEAKELGWRMFKQDDEWTHVCPNCVEERR